MSAKKKRGKQPLALTLSRRRPFRATPEERKNFYKLCVGSASCHISAEFPRRVALGHLLATGLSISNVDSNPAA